MTTYPETIAVVADAIAEDYRRGPVPAKLAKLHSDLINHLHAAQKAEEAKWGEILTAVGGSPAQLAEW